MASLSVRQVDGPQPTSALLTVTGWPAGAAISVERSTNITDWFPVRGGVNLVMPAGRLDVFDFAAPLTGRVFYKVWVNGHVEAITQIVLSDDRTWLQDAFSPHRGVPVRLDRLDDANDAYGPGSFRAASWPQQVSEARVMGASQPVESIGTRQRVGNVPLEIWSETPSRLRDLLLTAGPLLIRNAPCGLLAPVQYVVIPDLREVHLGNPHKVAQFVGTARFTREPAPIIIHAAWTWGQKIARIRQIHGNNVTWRQVREATGSPMWAQVRDNPTLWGGAP